MSDTVLVTLISSGVTLVGTIWAIISSVAKSRKENWDQIGGLTKKLDKHILDDDARAAKQARVRILRFDSDICHGQQFGESYYEDILDDIDFYSNYVEAHKDDFKNSIGQMAMKRIKDDYDERKKNNNFLK